MNQTYLLLKSFQKKLEGNGDYSNYVKTCQSKQNIYNKEHTFYKYLKYFHSYKRKYSLYKLS